MSMFTIPPVVFLSHLYLYCILVLFNKNVPNATGFYHNSCKRNVAKQFQFDDCYIPPLPSDLLLTDASFVMSHDAGTGYLQRNPKGIWTNGAANLYTKNQIGDVYQQLDDGARALDVRPKLLSDGTVVLHHGALSISITLETLVTDAIRWSNDNPTELVLILHHNLAYSSASNDDDNGSESSNNFNVPSADTAVAALSQVYTNLGVPYVSCSDLYGLTVGEAMEKGALSSKDNNEIGGLLLAMDQHDAYASSCAKLNYVEDSLVTCYSNEADVLPCTDRNSIQHSKLKEYAMASANNEPSDNRNVLGPPASSYTYPFFEIQALWQVDGISAALGVRHFSSIIDDNTKSHLNAGAVDWIYNDSFNQISLLAVDHVQLNGNAILSVLRNRCGQSELSYDQYYNKNNNDENSDANVCGMAIPKPRAQKGKPLSTLSFFATALVCMGLGLWIAIFLSYYRKHHDHDEEVKRIEEDFQAAIYECGCTSTSNTTYDDVNDITNKNRTSGINKEDPLLERTVI